MDDYTNESIHSSCHFFLCLKKSNNFYQCHSLFFINSHNTNSRRWQYLKLQWWLVLPTWQNIESWGRWTSWGLVWLCSLMWEDVLTVGECIHCSLILDCGRVASSSKIFLDLGPRLYLKIWVDARGLRLMGQTNQVQYQRK